LDPLKLIQKYYPTDSERYRILVTHGQMVRQKSLELAERVAHLKPDIQFLKEAAMLHDIAIFLTNAPEIDCNGKEHYLMHGPLGRDLLEKEGYPRHALVCDRHTGVGITKQDVIEQDLPLPLRDMMPISIEEKIICFADTFYRKDPENLKRPKSIEAVEQKMSEYGPDHIRRINEFRELFGV